MAAYRGYEKTARMDRVDRYGMLDRATDKILFTLVGASVGTRGREHTLWHGRLPNGQDLFVLSINRPYGEPRYDKGFRDRDEAQEFFSRYLPKTLE